MQKNVRKICVYQKFVVILHQNLKNEPNYKPKNNKIMKENELNKMLVKLAVISRKSLFRQRVRESMKNREPYIQLALNA